MSPLRSRPQHRKKADAIGEAVFYPPSTKSSLCTGRSVLDRSLHPSTTVTPNHHTLPGSTGKPALYSAPPLFVAMPTSPAPSPPLPPARGLPPVSTLRNDDDLSPLQLALAEYGDANEYPFPDSTPLSTLVPARTGERQTTGQSLTNMLQNWNLTTPPALPVSMGQGTFGRSQARPSDSVSTTFSELQSPPDMPGHRIFSGRVLPTEESPSINTELVLPGPSSPYVKPSSAKSKARVLAPGVLPRRASDSPVLTLSTPDPLTPDNQRAVRLGDVPASAPSAYASALASPTSPRPIPVRQPSWADVRRGSVPNVAYHASGVQGQTSHFHPPGGMLSPSQYVSPHQISPLVFPPPAQAIPPSIGGQRAIEHDLFTPGYSFGVPPPSFPPPNALQISLDPASAPPTGYGAFPTHQHIPTSRSSQSAYSQYSTYQPAQPVPAGSHAPVRGPEASTIAAKHLEEHSLPLQFEKNYRLLDELGAGGFGFVCSAITTGGLHPAGREVAVKFIIKDKIAGSQEGMMDGEPVESWVLRRCNHPSIIGWVDFYEDDKFYILVQELHGDPWSEDHTLHEHGNHDSHTDPGQPMFFPRAQFPSLPDVTISPSSSMSSMSQSVFASSPTSFRQEAETPVRPRMGRRASHDLFEAIETVRFSEDEARWIFHQIVAGVFYLHERGIYHRDLKDENIVIDRYYNAKIIDFGSAVVENKLHPPNVYGSFRGTYSYAAPEVLSGYHYYAAPCDIWALGVILSILLTGEQPFSDSAAALEGRFKLKRPTSEAARDLLGKIFHPHPDRRWTIEKIVKHKWLKNVKRPKSLPPLPSATPSPPLSSPAMMAPSSAPGSSSSSGRFSSSAFLHAASNKLGLSFGTGSSANRGAAVGRGTPRAPSPMQVDDAEPGPRRTGAGTMSDFNPDTRVGADDPLRAQVGGATRGVMTMARAVGMGRAYGSI